MELLLKDILKKRGVTLIQLSEKLGITRQALNSRLNSPKGETLLQIAKALECEVHELIPASEKCEHLYDAKGEWLGIRKK
jgi:transcriptional regulator with XRE-family HTH domain